MASLLVTGTGRSGSWKIRGEQLGQAIGARVLPFAPLRVCRAADLVVAVKRVTAEQLLTLRAAGTPWVWDVVDAWPQRAGTEFDEATAKRWLRRMLEQMQPHAVVWPTARMMQDAAWSGPQIVIPHHGWQRYTRRDIAAEVRVVGYEGAPPYLGKWEPVLRQECALRGWRLEINGDLQQADIGVALRDGGGYPGVHWKSNCKLANLQQLGIPALCSPEAGYLETASGAEAWVVKPGDVARAFDQLAPRGVREILGAQAHAARQELGAVAARYRGWLDGLA